MKTQKELNELKQECIEFASKLQELNEDELSLVTGGASVVCGLNDYSNQSLSSDSADPIAIACLVKGFFPLGSRELVKDNNERSEEAINLSLGTRRRKVIKLRKE